VVTHQQLVDLLLLAYLVGDVALNAQQTRHVTVLVATGHRDVHLIIMALLLRLRLSLDGDDRRRAFLVAYVEDSPSQHLEVVAVETLRELHGVILLLIRPLL